jgi:hypothetical protein
MAMFKRGPERELGHLARRRDQLESRLSEARASLDRAHEARNKALLEGDMDDSVANEHDRSCRAVDDRIVGLERALDELQHKIDQVEASVAAEKSKADRDKASVELLAHVGLVRDAVEQLRTSGQRLLETLRPMSSLPAAGPFLGHVALTLNEMPGAIEREIISVAEARAAEILSGTAQVSKPAPEPVVVPPPAPPVDRRSIILFQNSRWSEDGAVRYAAKFALVELPALVAERVITRNLGDDQNSLRGVNLRQSVGISHGPCQFAPDAVDLDKDPVTKKKEDDLADAVVTIGQPRHLLFDAERMRP